MELLKKAERQFSTRLKVLTNDHYKVAEKLRIVSARHPNQMAKQILMHQVQSDASGDRYFEIHGKRFYFEPPFEVKDDSYLLDGICIV